MAFFLGLGQVQPLTYRISPITSPQNPPFVQADILIQSKTSPLIIILQLLRYFLRRMRSSPEPPKN
ncbi:hypothetical protein MC7420_7183 [Coleofasciculus chthonoplastes PCC 7420]|uniref:Uncharacterized protein n=1 Tax=Coleofasciculus chthonoplastes PCC 7420 TaxID=118168 RepID=B4VGZ0_9CYAN|nr:hypothetical protein MC7420_7183 [Coleofasciculus chthonoplastes PCC 7420]